MSQSNLVAAIHNAKPKRNAFPVRGYNHMLPIKFETSEHESRWFRMSKSRDWMKPIVSCLAPHKESLMEMGIQTQLYRMFEQTHLYIDLVMGYPAHKDLVYEFLASFSVVHGETAFGDGSEWHFRIQNTNFSWSRNQALYFLDFPETTVVPKPSVPQLNDFWTKLTELKDFGRTSSPYSLHDDVWHYAHRLIATNINCQPESVDHLTEEDLELMWALDQGEPIDWFQIFSCRFLRMQYQLGPHRFVGCTSLITLIAKWCGFQFLGIPYEHRVLDLAFLKKLRIIARPCPFGPELSDATEPNSWEDEPVDTDDKAGEEGSAGPREKKQRVEIEYGKELNDKVDWGRVSRVVIYEFN